MDKNVVQFVRQKDYILVKDVGFGATGDVKLLKDEETNEYFVCKKYSLSPFVEGQDYYEYFKSEIKYKYYSKKSFSVERLKTFLFLLKSIPIEQKKIVLNNLWNRFDAKERFDNNTDDLPF